MADPATLLAHLEQRGWRLAVAEAACGGALSARFVAVPGASVAYAGGVVAYGNHAKTALLGVPGWLLEQRGAVDEEVAARMAAGARGALKADVGLAETGIAGPQAGRASGKRAGTVALAVVTQEQERIRTLELPAPDRASAQAGFVEAALELLAEVLGEG